MNILSRLWHSRKQRIAEINDRCQRLLDDTNGALSVINTLIGSDDIIDPVWAEHVRSHLLEEYGYLLTAPDKKLKKATAYRQLLAVRTDFIIKQEKLITSADEHNERVARKRLPDAYRTIGNVEGQKLDEQQMLSIVKETHNHLVIAGAGTGKTTTIVGKVKFLLRKGCCAPEDILVLSFTNASAAEMRERIVKEMGQSIEVLTFHKLGMNIIKACEGVVPKVTRVDLRSFVNEQLSALMERPQYLRLLSSFLLYHWIPSRSEFEFASETEYKEYLEYNPPTTLKNERVKSYGETDIANFLSYNGIVYEYEPPYLADTRTSEHGQYHPDFFLPEHKIYIEYFGIDRNGNVPSYFSGKYGKSASELYQRSMAWKRQLHKEFGTTMIECFAYEKFSGDLLVNLEKKLREHQIPLAPKDPKEIIDAERPLLDGFAELAETAINLIKSNGYSIGQVRGLIPAHSAEATSDNMILDLIEPIYDAYSQLLLKNGEIDFNDMINVATEYLSVGRYTHGYKHVIVDEYQDISKSRFSLLKAMRKVHSYSLFCVGDDWQSIFRFAGSDIGFILNFSKHWGPAQISRIETTYRFTQALVDISGGFVMRNPNQVKKSIRGNHTQEGFPLGEINDRSEYDLVNTMADRLSDIPQNASVFFIGRYNHDINTIRNDRNFSCEFDNVTRRIDIIFQRRKDLNITFLTVHRSKGLQADYVFILNNKRLRMGFPSKIQDSPILDLLLDSSDSYPHAEERRLFYVALTRAKKKAVLMTVEGEESEFVMELRAAHSEEMRSEREASKCPLCGGRLVKRSGEYGEFIGCSNYWSKNCKYKRKINGTATHE